MQKKNSNYRNILKPPIKSYISDKNISRSSLNKRLINLSHRQKNNYYIANSKSVQKRNQIYNSEYCLNNDKINKLKSYLPYIPNKERQKAEDNFIDLIKAIVDSRSSDKNKIKNIPIKNNENEKYWPRGYGYFEFIREHPSITRELRQNTYSQIIHDINKKIDGKNEKFNEKENSDKRDIFLNKKNNLTEINLFDNKNMNYIPTKILTSEGNENLKKTRINKSSLDLKINDNNKEKIDIENIKQNVFPVISECSTKQKDFHKSDIFYLVNDNLSKGKTSEQYLFKPNYSPRKLEKDKKTNINEVGWEPKLEKNKSRIGCSSVAFNIINPTLKCLSPMKKEIDSLNKNNFEKPPLISDYINMCKPGDTGLRKDYSDILEENKNIFHRKNYCASYSDLHHEYKDLVNKIF